MIHIVTDSWKEEHFITYLYLVVTDSDLDSSNSELDMASKKAKIIINNYFQDTELDLSYIFEIVKDELTFHDHSERKFLIDKLSKKFKLDQDLKIEIIGDLNDIINSDDIVLQSEHDIINYIRLVFTTN